MDRQIIIVKPKSISSKDKEKLTKAGNIVITANSPYDVTIKEPPAETLEFTYTNCYTCGDRIYITKERMSALKQNKKTFYCSQGHPQVYK